MLRHDVTNMIILLVILDDMFHTVTADIQGRI